MMDDEIYILRVGPVAGNRPGQKYLYVPVLKGAKVNDLVFGDSDEEAMASLRKSFPGMYFICDPEMTNEDGQDIEVARDLPYEMAVLRADLAISLMHDDRLPPSRPMALRRMLLFATGPFLASFSAQRLLIDGIGRGRVEGNIGAQEIATEVELRGTEDMEGDYIVEASSSIGSLRIRLYRLAQDSYVAKAMIYAYGTDYIPELIEPADLGDVKHLDHLYGVFGAALLTLSAIPMGADAHAEGLQPTDTVKLWTEIRIA